MTKQARAAARPATRNGITAPKRPGKIKAAWDLFDSAVSYIYASQVADIARIYKMNRENVAIELRRWKRFNGIETGLRAA